MSATCLDRRRILVAVTTIACLVVLQGLELPSDTYLVRELTSTGHVLIFGVLAVCMLLGQRTRGLRSYLTAVVLTLLLGAISEWMQIFSPQRDASLGDLLRDAAGAVGFLLLVAWWRRDFVPEVSSTVLACLAVVVFALGVAPLYLTWRDYRGRDEVFPTLCCFSGSWEHRFVVATSAEMERAEPPPGGNGHRWVQLTLLPSRWPGVSLTEVYPDWGGYDSLGFEIYSTNAEPVKLVLRVNDRAHDNAYRDRFNRNLNILPGLNRFEVPIDDILNAPKKRRMSVTEMATVVLFAVSPKEPLTIYWNGLRLSHRGTIRRDQ